MNLIRSKLISIGAASMFAWEASMDVEYECAPGPLDAWHSRDDRN
jgi:hypothetical protein